MKQYLFTCMVLLTLSFPASGQPQANNWMFSAYNGLNFSSGSPVFAPGCQMSLWEGAASISDQNGQLLFYTDGVNVWDRRHMVMLNGAGLIAGYGSSTQGCLIVPKTEDGLQYYIFTASEEGNQAGLNYTIVDMSLNNGYGAVTVKNVQLVASVCEKLTATRHCNNKDYWVITHKYNSDAFYAYQVNEQGVSSTPVISHTGNFIPVYHGTMAGGIAVSADGKKLAAAHASNGIDLFDFDNSTGIISNRVEIFGNYNAVHYDVEFSPNSQLLYAAVSNYFNYTLNTRFTGIFQFDLSLPAINDVINSKFEIFTLPEGNELGTLQTGPDGKIYMAQYRKRYLSVINLPNTVGMGCNFVNQAFNLPNETFFALPNMLYDYGINQPDSFRVTGPRYCADSAIGFTYTIKGNVSSVLWDFGDPGSGVANISTALNPTHTFSVAGTYSITLIKYGDCGNDTLSREVTIYDIYPLLGNDSSFCEKSSLLLDPKVSGNNTYLWNNGSTSSTIAVTSPGSYWVQVTSGEGCRRSDTIMLNMTALPQVHLGPDTLICPGETVFLDAQNPGAAFTWSDNSTGQTKLADNPGLYWVEVTAGGCKARDSVQVTLLQKPVFTLGADQFLCPGSSISLNPGLSNVQYQWQDGAAGSSYVVTQEGRYFVTISNRCGSTSDTIMIRTGSCQVYIPSAFSPNNDGRNDLFRVSGTQLITEFTLQVYNRWGELIFETRDKSKGWDGKLRGIPAPPGVYIYMLKYKESADMQVRMLKGTVTLIR